MSIISGYLEDPGEGRRKTAQPHVKRIKLEQAGKEDSACDKARWAALPTWRITWVLLGRLLEAVQGGYGCVTVFCGGCGPGSVGVCVLADQPLAIADLPVATVIQVGGAVCPDAGPDEGENVGGPTYAAIDRMLETNLRATSPARDQILEAIGNRWGGLPWSSAFPTSTYGPAAAMLENRVAGVCPAPAIQALNVRSDNSGMRIT